MPIQISHKSVAMLPQHVNLMGPVRSKSMQSTAKLAVSETLRLFGEVSFAITFLGSDSQFNRVACSLHLKLSLSVVSNSNIDTYSVGSAAITLV